MKQIVTFYRRFSQKNRLEQLLSTMPKDAGVHIGKNQKHRIRIKEKSKFYSPGTVNLQVLGSGARGASSSIYLFSEQSRYLFNCGEGTQRLAHEHRTKLTRMEHIFLTRNTWNRFGGVPGLCLTLQEIGVPLLNLHGPPGINDIFQSTRKFVVLRNMRVEAPKCEAGEYFEDSVMRVNYVPIYKNEMKPEEKVAQCEEKLDSTEVKDMEAAGTSFEDDTDYFQNEDNKKIDDKSDSSNESSNKKNEKPYEYINNMVMAYICKLRARPGSLDFELCVNKGVTPGPLLGRLKNGYDVKLPDGSIVKADEVCGPASPGSVFVFVDIPDESYLPSLMACDAFKPYQQGAVKEDDVAVIVIHFSPEAMTGNATYKEWMDRFSASTKHWFVNERNEFSGYFASHRIQRQLNELDENVFPLLGETHPYLRDDLKSEFNVDPTEGNPAKKFKIDSVGEKDGESVVHKFQHYPELGILSTFHIRPAKGFDRSLEPFSNPEKVVQETFAAPELCELIKSFKVEADKLIVCRSKAQRAAEYPKVVTFGTGSCIPNKTRNVSANLVHFSEDNCAMLDCGEGTLGQLVRFYGRDGTDEVLKNLRLIYVSHLHADHHLGLMDILGRRRKVTSEKVVLIAPSTIRPWLAFYNFRIEEVYSTFDMCSCADFLGRNVEQSVREKIYSRVGLVNIDTCFVEHCPHSYGVAFEMKNLMKSERFPNETVKITYSGDTLPCEDLVNIGQNSDVLIHEATMEDDLTKEARMKMHSTVSQAIDIGRQMKAKFVILTHFSQRYAKIPRMEGNVKNVAIAFDNMEVTLNDLPMMHLMYKPLKAMFSDHFELLEQKALKRKYAQEREIQSNLPEGNQEVVKLQ